MPVYTYRCENCGFQFDKFQKFVDQPLTRCPECEKKTLRKVYSPVGIVFKGSGFYSTDNRSPSGASRGQASKSGEGEKSASETGSSETPKTETKTESSAKDASQPAAPKKD
jgi:putative FmdB family regulatory protein